MTPRTHQWAALGTYAQISVDDPASADEALRIAQRLVTAIDVTCSRFRADSDLNRASRAAGTWVRVDPLLVRAVEAAVGAARYTGGLVDPTLGKQMAALGYDRDLRLVRRDPGPAAHSCPSAGRWTEIETDPAGWLRVPDGCALDLGATGKAFGADLVANAILRDLGCSVIVSLGGDVAAVSVDSRAGWQVLVSDTAGGDLDAPGQVVSLRSGGMATSSTRHRRWTSSGGQTLHHIVDPRTGRPADETIVSATVCGTTCVEANAASTAAIILGTDAATWMEARNLAALLVNADGEAVRCAGWPQPQLAGALC